MYDSDSDQEEPTYKLPVDNSNEKKWDCESIISTYSNIYNHPAIIKDPPVIFVYNINLFVIQLHYISYRFKK